MDQLGVHLNIDFVPRDGLEYFQLVSLHVQTEKVHPSPIGGQQD